MVYSNSCFSPKFFMGLIFNGIENARSSTLTFMDVKGIE